LEKIRPIDHKLRYQIDKLVKTAITGTSNSNDPLKFKANPGNLLSQFDGSDNESSDDSDEDELQGEKRKKKKSGGIHNDDGSEEIPKYVPPKLTSMPYEDDESIAQKQRDRAKKRAINSALIDEWKEEFLDTPVEIMGSSRAQQIVSREMKERERYEEDNFVRLPMTKADRHRQKRLSTMGTLAEEVTGYGGNNNSNSKKRKGGKSGKKSGKKRKFH
jgi:U3 small nucleolar ribonucleoprotein protein LCP5